MKTNKNIWYLKRIDMKLIASWFKSDKSSSKGHIVLMVLNCSL